MNTLRITATAHGLNYLPEYLANHTGLFQRCNLEVTSVAREPWDGVLADLASGQADVALGGLWVPAMYAGMARDLVVVGQLNDRFPMAVVTRQPVGTFDWAWLRGRVVLVPGQGGTAPYEFTAGLIREAGEDPHATRFVRDLATGMLAELFEHGLGDALVADLVTAVDLQQRGIGTIACHLASAGGRMPNSVYYVRRDRLAELRGRLQPFLAAIKAAMDELAKADHAQAEDVVAKEWPNADGAVMREATRFLLTSQTWNGIDIDRIACDRWVGILRDAGLVKAPVPFEQLVDTSALESAVSEP